MTPILAPPAPASVAADQQHTIDVLAELASRGLPVIGWHLSGIALDQLVGQANPDTDEQKRMTIGAYADLLDAVVVERRHDNHTRLTAIATYSGVRVTVYAHVEQASAVSQGLPAQELTEQKRQALIDSGELPGPEGRCMTKKARDAMAYVRARLEGRNPTEQPDGGDR